MLVQEEHRLHVGVIQGDGGSEAASFHNHLHWLGIQWQPKLRVHQDTRLPPVYVYIYTVYVYSSPSEMSQMSENLELKGLVARGAAVGVQGENQRGKDAATNRILA